MITHDLNKLFSLDGRIVLITGATGHLGAPIAKAVAFAGGVPITCGRNQSKLEALSLEIKSLGGACMSLAFDISDSIACKDAITQINTKFGKLHGIINCAYGGRPGTIESSTEQDFQIACQQSLTAPFLLIQASADLLKKGALDYRGGASVINVSTMYGMVSPDPRIYGNSGNNNPPYYGAAKAGLIQLTRYLAVHLAPDNVRVNSISPGPFPPKSIRQTQPAFHAVLCEKTPMARIGRADELTGPVLFLLSDASSYVTGVNLPVDGGWTAW